MVGSKAAVLTESGFGHNSILDYPYMHQFHIGTLVRVFRILR